MENSCSICFYPIDKKISCRNPMCSAVICYECGESFIKFSHKEHEMPRCPATSCRQHYLYSDIIKLGPDIQIMYNDSCFEYLKNDKRDEVNIKLNHNIMIEKIRKEKEEFIKKQFPIAISLTIQNSLSTKLKKINRTNREHLQKMMDKSNKSCMNLFCPGKIKTDTMKCMTCETEFCEKCECPLKEEHICSQDDIDSVKFIDNLVRCPNVHCRLPVIRSYGCNHITCSVCKTNFNYVTGEKTVAGNHDNTTTILRNTLKLSDKYMDEYPEEIMNRLRDIEDMIPVQVTLTHALNILMKENSNNKTKNMIAKEYERYMLYQYKKKTYYKIMNTIQDHHISKTLTKEILNKIISVLE